LKKKNYNLDSIFINIILPGLMTLK